MNDSLNRQHQQVARLVYELWEWNERPAGSAEKDWLLAEQILEFYRFCETTVRSPSLEPNED